MVDFATGALIGNRTTHVTQVCCIIPGQIRRDVFPFLSTIARLVNQLTAIINDIGVVLGNNYRWVPIVAIFNLVRWFSEGENRVGLNGFILTGFHIMLIDKANNIGRINIFRVVLIKGNMGRFTTANTGDPVLPRYSATPGHAWNSQG